jgi:hypothetical protein
MTFGRPPRQVKKKARSSVCGISLCMISAAPHTAKIRIENPRRPRNLQVRTKVKL